jgi:AraC-like DNA-binding protein
VHANNIKDSFSHIERISLVWLRNVLIALFLLWIMYLFTEMASPWIGMTHEAWYALHLMVVSVIFALGYLGVRQPAIFSALKHQDQSHTAEPISDSAAGKLDTAAPVSRDKYQKSALTEAQSETILHALQKVMVQQKPYLDDDLNLPKLAEILKISPHHLSQVINERLEVNFFDFVNRYRVEEAKRQLAKVQRRRPNILTIALDAGFNSKSAFYTAFKRHTEMTPSQFRKLAISGS